jgi:hypothetical protein
MEEGRRDGNVSCSRNSLCSPICGLAVLALVVGCRTWIPVQTEETVRDQNRERLVRLSVGMTRPQVLENMGTESVQTYKKSALPSRKGSKRVSDETQALYRGKQINNPYRTEASRTAEGVSVEILFYYTDQRKSDGAITDDELTPLVIENGVLAGWGWNFLDYNVEKYQIELLHQ